MSEPFLCPFCSGLHDEKDCPKREIQSLRAQVLALAAERDASIKNLLRVAAEWDKLRAERDEALAARDGVRCSMETAGQDYANARKQRDAANARADAAEKKLLDGNQA